MSGFAAAIDSEECDRSPPPPLGHCQKGPPLVLVVEVDREDEEEDARGGEGEVQRSSDQVSSNSRERDPKRVGKVVEVVQLSRSASNNSVGCVCQGCEEDPREKIGRASCRERVS